jgi:phosphoribosylformylglycinamidine synthase
MIKKTSLENPNDIVSAYKDNVAFVKGPQSNLLQKRRQTWFYQVTEFDSVIS